MSIELLLRDALGLFVAYFGFGFVLLLPSLPINSFSKLELYLTSFSLSTGCLTLLMLLLGLLQILTPYSLMFSILIVTAFSASIWIYRLKRNGKFFPKFKLDLSSIQAITNPTVLAFLIGVATLLFLVFYHALLFPQILWDTLTVYAFLGKRIYLDLKIPFFSGASGSVEWSGNYPMLVPMLYAWFNFSLGGVNDYLCRSISPVFGFATLVVTFALAKKLHGSTAALLSVYILAVTPIFLAHSMLGYIDIVLTYFFVSTIYFLYTASENKDKKRAFLSGFMGGLAAWTKYQGLILVLIIIAYWIMIRFKDKTVDSIFLRSLFAFVISASPWYLRNIVLLGNPVYPNLFAVFGGRNLDPWLLSQNFDFWVGRWAVILGTDHSLNSLLYLPITLLIKDNSLFSLGQDGVGLLLTAFGVPGLILSVLRRRKGDLLLLSSTFIFFSLWLIFLYQFIRYLLPIVPLICIFGGDLLNKIINDIGKFRKPWKVSLILIIIAPLLTAFLIPSSVLALVGPSVTFKDYIFSRPFVPPSVEEALRHAIPADYAFWQFINEKTSSDSVFLSFDHRWYFVNRELAFADGSEMEEIYFVNNVSQAVDYLLKAKVTHIIVEPWYKELPLWYKSPLFRELDNTTFFTQVFNEQGYEIYEIKGAKT